MAYRKRAGRRKERRQVTDAIAHIRASYNNTLFTITDKNGSVLLWSSSGKIGFKGSKKKSPFASLSAGEEIGKRAVEMGVINIAIRLSGPGQGRDHAIRALHAAGLNITSIRDVTPIPHNGCRLPKQRRN